MAPLVLSREKGFLGLRVWLPRNSFKAVPAKEQLAGAESSVVEGQNIRRLPRTPRDPTLPFPSSLGLCGWPPREDALEGGLSPSKTPSLEEAPATTCFLEIVRSCAG